MLERFMYWKPTEVTRPWLPRFFRGGDEWHNASVAVVLPFLGCFIFFYEKDFNRDGEEHVHGQFGGQWEGQIVEDCDECCLFVGICTVQMMPRPL